MALVNLVLDKKSSQKDGTYPLKIGGSYKKYFQISLDISLKSDN